MSWLVPLACVLFMSVAVYSIVGWRGVAAVLFVALIGTGLGTLVALITEHKRPWRRQRRR